MSVFLDQCYEHMNKGEVIVAYKGTIGADIITNTLSLVELKLEDIDVQNAVKKKLYNILVESLQNLYHHVDKVPDDFEDQTSEKFGMLIVQKVDRGYKIITGNFVKADNVERLEEKIKKINRSSHEEIKELYKFILNHQRISAKGGGGLGLVDIARKTGNKLEYTFKEYNDKYSFFYLDILVNEDN